MTPTIKLRVTADERAAWQQAAGSETLSGWLRRLARQACLRRGVAVPEPSVAVARARGVGR